jgi:hypothetical protein
MQVVSPAILDTVSPRVGELLAELSEHAAFAEDQETLSLVE